MKAFISYSHKDETLREELEEHLALLRRQGKIDAWTDRRIEPGDRWADEIDQALEEAEIILLLISSSFVASDFCYDKEMKRAMERHAEGSARVVPIIVRPCDWHDAPFGALQGLPKDGKAITAWEDRDTAWLDVVKGLRKVQDSAFSGNSEQRNADSTLLGSTPSGNSVQRKSPSILQQPLDLDQLFEEIETPYSGVVPLWKEIPPGEFSMGSPEGEGYSEEHPVHSVKIVDGFQMSAVTVTAAQFAAFAQQESASNDPIIGVDWRQAMEFCQWLSRQFEWAKGARLPTEEEWEYACRAGTTTKYWSGDLVEDLARVGWYLDNSDGRVHQVGEKEPNPFGLYDMHGNVWEWTSSQLDRNRYADRATGNHEVNPRTAAQDISSDTDPIFRGGSFASDQDGTRAAFRDRFSFAGWPTSLGGIGFRILIPSDRRSPGPVAVVGHPAPGVQNQKTILDEPLRSTGYVTNESPRLELSLRETGSESRRRVGLRFEDPRTSPRIVEADATLDFDGLDDVLLDSTAYGEMLSRSVFGDPKIESAYREALYGTETSERTLRVQVLIPSEDPKLQTIRWELLRDPVAKTFFSSSERTPFSRFMNSPDPRAPRLRSQAGFKILAAVSAPTNLGRDLAAIDSEVEIDRIVRASKPVIPTSLGDREPLTLARLTAGLAEDVDVLYLACHGTIKKGTAYLYLQESDGTAAYVDGPRFAETVARLAVPPRLAILASCRSGDMGDAAESTAHAALASLLAEAGIPAVLAMQGNISMPSVETMMPAFFRELMKDGRIDRALARARALIRDERDHWMPVLYLRLKDGRLWRSEVGSDIASETGKEFEESPPVQEPAPKKTDSKTEEICKDLDAAYERRAILLASGESVADVDKEILGLKRRIRDGAKLSPGDLLSGRFKLLEPIGRGGFAQVWKAYDRQNKDLVAVKVLHGQHGHDLSRRQRFFRGAKQMKRLQHQGVVRVVEEEMEDTSLYFFVMEYLSGGDLRQAILSGALDRDARLRIIAEVGEALAFAHERDLVHRDVKPANILLDADGRAKLTDFDLVRALDTTGGTQRTQGMGTVVFAAPELMEHAADADVRADVYGLAATAIFVLRGKPLKFKEMTLGRADLVKSLDVPPACRDVLLRGIEWEPEGRPESVREFCEALTAAFKKPEVVVTRPVILSPKTDFKRLFSEIQTRDGVVPLWRAIPAGEFLIGSPKNEGFDREKPQHLVRITSDFQMAVTAVTNAQYAAFDSKKADTSKPNHPVVNVNWHDAMKFCEWLGNQFRWARGARLPTEEEWEYACRAGSTTHYWSGDAVSEIDRVGWYRNNSEDELHRVGEKPANPFGLYDMHGNVWEWTSSEWTNDYSQRQDGRMIDPQSADLAALDPGVRRVVRGGSFANDADWARSAARNHWYPRLEFRNRGFRVLRPSVPELDH